MTSGPGAGHYYKIYGDTGAGIKRAVSARHREGVHAGYPNRMIQPVDTLGKYETGKAILCLIRAYKFATGFKTPGPNYWTDSERGPKHVIAATLKKKEADTLGPG